MCKPVWANPTSCQTGGRKVVLPTPTTTQQTGALHRHQVTMYTGRVHFPSPLRGEEGRNGRPEGFKTPSKPGRAGTPQREVQAYRCPRPLQSHRTCHTVTNHSRAEKTALKAGARISSCALKCYRLSYACWAKFGKKQLYFIKLV